MPAAQVGRPGEVPRGLASIPVSAEDLDQPLNTHRIEGLGLDPGKILHLANLEVRSRRDCLEDGGHYSRVGIAQNLKSFRIHRKHSLPDMAKDT